MLCKIPHEQISPETIPKSALDERLEVVAYGMDTNKLVLKAKAKVPRADHPRELTRDLEAGMCDTVYGKGLYSHNEQLQRSLVQWADFNQYQGRVIFHHSKPEDSIVENPPPTYRCPSKGHVMEVVENATYWHQEANDYVSRSLTCEHCERLFARGRSEELDEYQGCGSLIGPQEMYLTCKGCEVHHEREGHKFKRPLVICEEHMHLYNAFRPKARRRRNLVEWIRD